MQHLQQAAQQFINHYKLLDTNVVQIKRTFEEFMELQSYGWTLINERAKTFTVTTPYKPLSVVPRLHFALKDTTGIGRERTSLLIYHNGEVSVPIIARPIVDSVEQSIRDAKMEYTVYGWDRQHTEEVIAFIQQMAANV